MVALWMLSFVLGASAPESDPAQTVRALLDQENYTEACLGQIVGAAERKTPLEALTCAHAYACGQAYGGAKTPQTAGCISRSMDALTQTAEFEAAVRDGFESAHGDVRRYWHDCGALPERVVSCAQAAEAMFCAQRDGNLWKQMVAYEAYRRRCSLGSLLNVRPDPTADKASPSSPP